MFRLKSNKKSVVVESYKKLRSNLQYSLIEKGLKTILITSPNDNEGKTTVASRMADEFSKIDKSVVLVDCNFRHPSIAAKFKIRNEAGLSNAIREDKELKWVIEQYSENLSIIPAGNMLSGSTEILASDQLKKIIRILRESYDVIILDSPSILKFTDAQILSTMADATVLVVKAEKTKINDCEESKQLLDNIGSKIAGTVLMGKM